MHFLPPLSRRCLLDLVDLIFSKSFWNFSYALRFQIKIRGSRSIGVCLRINNNLFFEFHTIRAFFLFFGRNQITCFFSHHVTICFNILLQKLCLFLIRIEMGSSILSELEGRHSIALFYFLFCFVLPFLLL